MPLPVSQSRKLKVSHLKKLREIRNHERLGSNHQVIQFLLDLYEGYKNGNLYSIVGNNIRSLKSVFKQGQKIYEESLNPSDYERYLIDEANEIKEKYEQWMKKRNST